MTSTVTLSCRRSRCQRPALFLHASAWGGRYPEACRCVTALGPWKLSRGGGRGMVLIYDILRPNFQRVLYVGTVGAMYVRHLADKKKRHVLHVPPRYKMIHQSCHFCLDSVNAFGLGYVLLSSLSQFGASSLLLSCLLNLVLGLSVVLMIQENKVTAPSTYVRMYVCMYVCMSVCTYVHTYVRTYVRTYVCMYVRFCMYVRTYVRTYVCMYTCIHVRIHVCLFVGLFVCLYVSTCLYMSIVM